MLSSHTQPEHCATTQASFAQIFHINHVNFHVIFEQQSCSDMKILLSSLTFLHVGPVLWCIPDVIKFRSLCTALNFFFFFFCYRECIFAFSVMCFSSVLDFEGLALQQAYSLSCSNLEEKFSNTDIRCVQVDAAADLLSFAWKFTSQQLVSLEVKKLTWQCHWSYKQIKTGVESVSKTLRSYCVCLAQKINRKSS